MHYLTIITNTSTSRGASEAPLLTYEADLNSYIVALKVNLSSVHHHSLTDTHYPLQSDHNVIHPQKDKHMQSWLIWM